MFFLVGLEFLTPDHFDLHPRLHVRRFEPGLDMVHVVHDEPGPRTGLSKPGIGGFHVFGFGENTDARTMEQPTGILLPFRVALYCIILLSD